MVFSGGFVLFFEASHFHSHLTAHLSPSLLVMLYARINPLELRYTAFLNNGSIDAVPRYRSCWLCLVMAVPWLAVPCFLLITVQWVLSIAVPWFLHQFTRYVSGTVSIGHVVPWFLLIVGLYGLDHIFLDAINCIPS